MAPTTLTEAGPGGPSGALEDELGSLEARVAEIDAAVRAAALGAEGGAWSAELAQLKAVCFEFYTSELSREVGRGADKQRPQLARIESLIGGIERVSAAVRARESTSAERSTAEEVDDILEELGYSPVGSPLPSAGGGEPEFPPENNLPNRCASKLSMPSEQALAALSSFEEELSQLALRAAEIDVEARTAAPGPELGRLRDELAQLEARANKIEGDGIDNIYTGELSSGKARAKSLKKEQLACVEQLLQDVEATFRAMKKRAEPKAPPPPVDTGPQEPATPTPPAEAAAPAVATAPETEPRLRLAEPGPRLGRAVGPPAEPGPAEAPAADVQAAEAEATVGASAKSAAPEPEPATAALEPTSKATAARPLVTGKKGQAKSTFCVVS